MPKKQQLLFEKIPKRNYPIILNQKVWFFAKITRSGFPHFAVKRKVCDANNPNMTSKLHTINNA